MQSQVVDVENVFFVSRLQCLCHHEEPPGHCDTHSTMSDSFRGACQAPLSMEFSRQEYWGGLPFPSPGDPPNPGMEPRSSALQADSLSSESPGGVLKNDRQLPSQDRKYLHHDQGENKGPATC